MEKFDRLTAVCAPLVRANVDTDAIIPSREMKTVSKTGLADGLFAGWRYTEIGGREPDPEFVLNKAEYAGTRILLGGENFGCGSSREHAVWALHEYGIRAVVAPTFAPIFAANCVRNGLVPARLPLDQVRALQAVVEASPATHRVTVDLVARTVSAPGVGPFAFEIEDEPREMLLEGMDAIDLTLKHRAAIDAFHARDRRDRPWIYLAAPARHDDGRRT
jgi:3-isopropylmalate/(R)-2-methylmalate dehydratase small subunit